MIIETLTARRKELALQIRELLQSLEHLDATIKLFQPDYKFTKTKVRLRRGGIARELFDILREAKAPITTREIAERMVGADNVGLKTIIRNVGAALYNYQKKGMIKSTLGKGAAKLWAITE